MKIKIFSLIMIFFSIVLFATYCPKDKGLTIRKSEIKTKGNRVFFGRVTKSDLHMGFKDYKYN